MLFQNSFGGMGGISGYPLVLRLLKVLKCFSSLEVVIFIFEQHKEWLISIC